MIKALDLLWEAARHGEPFEFGSEAGAQGVFGVVVERLRSCSLGVLNFFAAIGNVFFERIEGGFHEFLFASRVVLFVQICPIAPVGVGAADDGKSFFAGGSSARVVKAKRSRGDVAV